jgi:hypothetical protein
MIADQIGKGIPADRIVVSGFSQGQVNMLDHLGCPPFQQHPLAYISHSYNAVLTRRVCLSYYFGPKTKLSSRVCSARVGVADEHADQIEVGLAALRHVRIGTAAPCRSVPGSNQSTRWREWLLCRDGSQARTTSSSLTLPKGYAQLFESEHNHWLGWFALAPVMLQNSRVLAKVSRSVVCRQLCCDDCTNERAKACCNALGARPN